MAAKFALKAGLLILKTQIQEGFAHMARHVCHLRNSPTESTEICVFCVDFGRYKPDSLRLLRYVCNQEENIGPRLERFFKFIFNRGKIKIMNWNFSIFSIHVNHHDPNDRHYGASCM